jgi:hypothetical protein
MISRMTKLVLLLTCDALAGGGVSVAGGGGVSVVAGGGGASAVSSSSAGVGNVGQLPLASGVYIKVLKGKGRDNFTP